MAKPVAPMEQGTALIDSDDFRDKHERAMRDHVLGAPGDHVCDDLCSGSILDRMLGRSPSNEYPRTNWEAALRQLAGRSDMERVTRGELEDAFTFWMIEAEHKDFRPVQTLPEEYGVQAADHLLRLLRLERTG